MSSRTPSFVLPYEPGSTEHLEAERRHREIKAWMTEREKLIESPPIGPDKPHCEKKAA